MAGTGAAGRGGHRCNRAHAQAGATTDGIPYLHNTANGRSVLVGHPLWRRSEDRAVEEEIVAIDELAGTSSAVAQSDVFEALRRPIGVIRRLV